MFTELVKKVLAQPKIALSGEMRYAICDVEHERLGVVLLKQG